MLHMMVLAVNEAAKVENNTLGVVALTGKGGGGVLESRDLLLVALSLTLQFLGNLLLENESLESVITLFLGAREAESETSSIILLLINKTSKSAVLALVVLNLDFEL